MAQSGRMNRERMAVNVPVDSPLYNKPPFYYRDSESLAFVYETDEEAALDVLPDALQLSVPAVATALITNFPFTTFGSYQEASLSIRALWEGQPVNYVVYNLLNSDAALCAGREIWGVPKKLVQVRLERREEGVVGTVERPRGTVICSGVIRPETPTGRAGGQEIPLVSLRVVPHPEGAPPLIQLIEHTNSATANWKSMESRGQWQGTGSLVFPAQSAVDPWHKFKVRRMRRALYSYGSSSFELPYGKILKTYE